MLTLVLHKSDTKKQSVQLQSVKVNTSNKVVVMVNMVTFGSDLNLTQAKDLNSSTQLLVVQSQENTSNLLVMAYKML